MTPRPVQTPRLLLAFVKALAIAAARADDKRQQEKSEQGKAA